MFGFGTPKKVKVSNALVELDEDGGLIYLDNDEDCKNGSVSFSRQDMIAIAKAMKIQEWELNEK
jgi:hypothetical protein